MDLSKIPESYKSQLAYLVDTVWALDESILKARYKYYQNLIINGGPPKDLDKAIMLAIKIVLEYKGAL